MGSSWGCAGVECDRGGSEAKGSSVDHDKRCLTKFNNRWQLQFTAWRRRPSQDICANTEIIIMTCSPRQGQDVVEQCSGPWRGAWPGRGNETERGQRQCPSLVASRNGMQIALSGSKSCKGDLMTHLAVLPPLPTLRTRLLPQPYAIYRGLQRVFAVQLGNYLAGYLALPHED